MGGAAPTPRGAGKGGLYGRRGAHPARRGQGRTIWAARRPPRAAQAREDYREARPRPRAAMLVPLTGHRKTVPHPDTSRPGRARKKKLAARPGSTRRAGVGIAVPPPKGLHMGGLEAATAPPHGRPLAVRADARRKKIRGGGPSGGRVTGRRSAARCSTADTSLWPAAAEKKIRAARPKGLHMGGLEAAAAPPYWSL